MTRRAVTRTTESKQRPRKPAEPDEIRDLIRSRVPTGPHLVLDVGVADGLVKVMVQMGSLRYSAAIALGERPAKVVADQVCDDLLQWARDTYDQVHETEGRVNKYRKVARGFQTWIASDPRARQWLRGEPIGELEAA